MGAELLDIAKAAEHWPLPARASHYDDPGTHRLVRTCRELQHRAGDQPFRLSCQDAVVLVGAKGPKPKMTAWKRLLLLQLDRVIELVEKGNRAGASQFRYIAV